ncbi:MAG: hypothetical protein R3A80_04365 [Bdellovibrionota bacterium]
MEVVKNSSGIKAFHTALSSWAVDFIRSEGITSENLARSEKFRSLPRSQKDAVRYQLKKQSAGKKISVSAASAKLVRVSSFESRKMPKRWIQRGSVGLGIWISVFLMRDLVEFYEIKGLSFVWALQLALVVELALFFASVSGKRLLSICAYALLFYNASIFVLLQTTKAHQQRESSVIHKNKMQETQQEIRELEKQRAENLRRLDKLFSKGMVTSGTRAISEMNAKIDKEVWEREQWIEKEGKLISNGSGHYGFTLGTLLMIGVRLILQLVSIELFRCGGICALSKKS